MANDREDKFVNEVFEIFRDRFTTRIGRAEKLKRLYRRIKEGNEVV